MCCRKMPNTRSGVSRTREAVNKQSDRRMAEALRVRDAVRNLKTLMGDEFEQEEVEGNGNGENGDRGNRNGGNRDGGNGNGGNGNGNGNEGEYGYNFRGFMPARECTCQDFLKCQPLNFNGTEGVVGLTRWFEKMETVFHISNCPEKYQVKYSSCTLLNSALTWWNSHKRTTGNEVAYAMSWAELMKLMTEVYCPRNEIYKMETELWNLTVKGNELTVYTQRLPYNIQGNVIAANPARFLDVVRIANQLMDKKLQGYAARSVESKRMMESNSRDNRGQQPPFKSGNEATVKAYAIGGGGTNPDSNVVTGTFILNNCYASMLFDSGVDRSFVSSTFSALLDITPSTLDTSYAVELADERISETNVVLRGCTLGLLGHPFDINLMPVELGSFDVIINMDWLAKYHALIVCDEKVIRIPYRDEVLIIRGDDYGNGSKLNIISCTRTQKYIQKGCQVYLAQVTSKKAEDKSICWGLGNIMKSGSSKRLVTREMMMCKQAEQGVSNIKLRQAEWLEDTDKRMIPGSGITLQLHKAKIQEVSPAESIKYRTIHKFAPKCATYHGRSTFANPKYLKKAQSDKPRLYEIPYDTSDPANRFCPDGEDTVTLEKESRSKLDKDKVKPYNYTYQNSLYETFKPPSKTYLIQYGTR
ncbi:putative reverse transcriptase domain-containing protein [Tanacetum coccineum]